MNDKNNQKGATMMEMMGVLTIIILLSVSAIQLIGSIFNMFRESLVANEVKDLQKAITDRYRFEGNYRRLFEENSDVEAFLCESKMAPFQMCSDGDLFHRMGGEVSVVAWDDEYDKYSIIFYDMPKKACVRAGEINWRRFPAVLSARPRARRFHRAWRVTL